MSALRRFHVVMGLGTLAAFLSTGAYMLLVAHPDTLPDGPHLMFLSRHIYILGAALVQLMLGAYVAPLSTARRRRLQWVGSGLLAAASVLLVQAFVVEPVAGRERTLVSSLGLYALFAGAMVHVLVALRRGPQR